MTLLRTVPASALLFALVACSTPEQGGAEDADKAAASPGADGKQADGKEIDAPDDKAAAGDPNALTPEDQRLIAADPKTLSPDENRQRAHALRKKIMQNPDSEAAKALEEARQAVLAGDVQPPPTASEASEPAPPAADEGRVIELPPHLREPASKDGG